VSDYLWIIAFLLPLTILWVLWLFLRIHLQAKTLLRVEKRANRIGRRLRELSGDSSDAVSQNIYIELVQNFNLEDLWARVRTRISVGSKNSNEVAELVVKIARLLSAIEELIRNDFTSRSIAQIGEWDEHKIAFFRDAGVNQRASIAAIYQLVTDIKRELS